MCKHSKDMSSEACAICETPVPFSNTVHIMIHTRSDAGIVDYYVCRDCYEETIAPLFDGSD